MTSASPTLAGFAVERITVVPWPDPVIDQLGHDPRSPYVERFWLGLLGPSTTLLLRQFAERLDDDPDGFEVDPVELAGALGIGGRTGRDGPFVRALLRCCRFQLARELHDTQGVPAALAVRRKLPPLAAHQVRRLPPGLQAAHRLWESRRPAGPDPARMRERARAVAWSLLEAGDDPATCEHQLREWGFHPAISHEATRWAADTRAAISAQG